MSDQEQNQATKPATWQDKAVSFLKWILNGILFPFPWYHLLKQRMANQRKVDKICKGRRYNVMDLVLIEHNHGKEEKDDDVYIIFIDYEYMVQLKVVHSKNTSFEPEQLHWISKAAELNDLACSAFSKTKRLAFKRKVAHIFSVTIFKKYEIAEAAYQKTLEYYEQLSVDAYRYRQIFLSLLLYLSLGFLLLMHYKWECEFIKDKALFLFLLASLAGSFFSIVKNASRKRLNANYEERLQAVDILARGFIALTIGGIVWCLMKSQESPCPCVMDGAAKKHFSYIIMAFLAGLSDSFFPSLISKYFPSSGEDGFSPVKGENIHVQVNKQGNVCK